MSILILIPYMHKTSNFTKKNSCNPAAMHIFHPHCNATQQSHFEPEVDRDHSLIDGQGYFANSMIIHISYSSHSNATSIEVFLHMTNTQHFADMMYKLEPCSSSSSSSSEDQVCELNGITYCNCLNKLFGNQIIKMNVVSTMMSYTNFLDPFI